MDRRGSRIRKRFARMLKVDFLSLSSPTSRQAASARLFPLSLLPLQMQAEYKTCSCACWVREGGEGCTGTTGGEECERKQAPGHKKKQSPVWKMEALAALERPPLTLPQRLRGSRRSDVLWRHRRGKSTAARPPAAALNVKSGC